MDEEGEEEDEDGDDDEEDEEEGGDVDGAGKNVVSCLLAATVAVVAEDCGVAAEPVLLPLAAGVAALGEGVAALSGPADGTADGTRVAEEASCCGWEDDETGADGTEEEEAAATVEGVELPALPAELSEATTAATVVVAVRVAAAVAGGAMDVVSFPPASSLPRCLSLRKNDIWLAAAVTPLASLLLLLLLLLPLLPPLPPRHFSGRLNEPWRTATKRHSRDSDSGSVSGSALSAHLTQCDQLQPRGSLRCKHRLCIDRLVSAAQLPIRAVKGRRVRESTVDMHRVARQRHGLAK